jgi:hypothetical protein
MERPELEKIVNATHVQGKTVGFFRIQYSFLYSCGNCHTYNELESRFLINNPIFACKECQTRNLLKGHWDDNKYYSQ